MAMKCAKIVLLVQLLPFFVWSQTGADCANAIPLTLDGVCRTYPTSSSTGPSVICTSYAGDSPITFFTFTTNSTPDKVLIDVTAPTAEPCEVALYTSGCGTMYTSGGMCFDDGKGLWSFAYNFTIQPNTTYKLRIKTTTTGNITLCAKNYTPTNNTCAGATSIGTTPLTDNNACNTPGAISPASLLCAATLENTAFYQFYVASDGYCVVNIGSINCDNGNGNNSNGFQVGFFTGSCSSLSHLGCDSNSNVGSNSFLQFTTPSLTAGTKVIVAIDGIQGSNCSYTISGINILSVLSTELEDFSGWKDLRSNILKWTILNEIAGQYIVERSENGKDFYAIGKLDSKPNGKPKTSYTFEDDKPLKQLFYRIKQVRAEGRIAASKIIQINRNDIPELNVLLVNPVVGNNLDMTILSENKLQLSYVITTFAGQYFSKGIINCNAGTTRLNRDLSTLSSGKYFITLSNKDKQLTRSFIKMN